MCALAFPSGPAPRCDAKSVIWGVRCQLSLSGAVASSVFLRVLAGDLSSKAAPVRIRHGRGLLRRRHPHHGADHHEGRRQAGSRSFTRVSASSALSGVVPGCVPSPRGDGEQQCSCCSCGSPLSVLPQALKWHLSPLTIVSWLSVYLQVAYLNDVYEVLLPQYPQQIFIQIAEASGHALWACRAAGRSRGSAGPGGGRRFQRPFLPVAVRPLRPGCWLPRIFLRSPCCFCLVPFLFIRTDAKGFRCVRRWVEPPARPAARD